MTTTLPRPTAAPTGAQPTSLPALAVTTGGVLFAAGNAIHPLVHDEAALGASTWVAAHLTFGAGALLVAAGSGVLLRRLRPSRLAVTGLALLWTALVLMPIGSVLEGYVAPALGFARFEEFEGSIAWYGALSAVPTLAGPVLVAIGALRHRLLPVPVALALTGITLGGVLAGAVPVEGWALIPGTVVFGLGVAAAGWTSRHPA